MDTTQTYPARFGSLEEWREYRRKVNAKYHASEKGRARMRQANASPLAKARYERYRQTDKYRAAQERRRQKDKAAGWPYHRMTRARLLAEHPERLAARGAVSSALRAGLMVRPAECSACGSVRAIHAHHHLGYEPQHWLTVEWLCAKCHRARHV